MKSSDQLIEAKLDVIGGVSKAEIGKQLHVAKATVVKVLRGYDEGKAQ